MKRILITLVLLVVPAAAWSGTGPKIEFDQATRNIGKIHYGDTAKTKFSFTNKGDETLLIKSISADCGCTKALVGSREIPPNAKGEVVASFDTEGMRAGTKEKHVYIASNDTKRPEVKLTLIAEVSRDLEAEPQSVAKKLPKFEETVSFPIKVTNSSDKEYKVTGIQPIQEGTKVSLKPETCTLEPGKTALLDIVVNLAGHAHQPIMMGKVMLLTNHPQERDLEIRYLIQVTKSN
jgi:hypothetical protein